MKTVHPRLTHSILLVVSCALSFAAPSARAQSNYEPYFFGTFAGAAPGSADGIGSAARFKNPYAVAVDSSGNVFVADTGNHTIRKITAGGVVSTFAGSAGNLGSVNGTGAAARFNSPSGVAVDAAGNVYVADTYNHIIRKITSAGAVSTFAGAAGIGGSADGTGGSARFFNPGGVAVDGGGNVFVADSYNHTIRKITPASVVSTIAGSAGNLGSTDGTGAAARFQYPLSVAVDPAGTLYVADTYNDTIRTITPGGQVSTLAGLPGNIGTADGTGSSARFDHPSGVTVDSAGKVNVADSGNSTVRAITPAGVVSTAAGLAGNIGSTDGNGSSARFDHPSGLCVDGAGNLFVADLDNATIRKIAPPNVVSTLAGVSSASGSADGPRNAARFFDPSGVALDSGGNVYVSDNFNNTIRKITPAGAVSTLAGLAGTTGSTDGTGSAARFDGPFGLAVDSAGNVYVADTSNYTIRVITPSGTVSTLAGLPGSAGSADGVGNIARFNFPRALTVDGAGNVFVADTSSHTIRKITPAGIVTTLAGSAGAIGTADGGGGNARFNFPFGIAVDGSNNLYVADSASSTIRKITPAGFVTTLAGSANSNGSADGLGTAARFNTPYGVAVDASGTVYVADTYNHTIRKITPAGQVTTLGGLPETIGSADGIGSSARFYNPSGIARTSAGRIYVADQYNNTIRGGELPLVVTSIESRKTHGPAGTFALSLALSGRPTVESRTGGANGDHTLAFIFNNEMAGGNVSVTSGAGSIAGSPTAAGNALLANVTGVANAQTLGFSLTSVTDALGQTLPDQMFSASFLLADTNGDGAVNTGDTAQTRNRSGQGADSTNFRSDVNTDGTINSGDNTVVRTRSGTALDGQASREPAF